MIERNLKYGLCYNVIANCKRKNDGVANAAERGDDPRDQMWIKAGFIYYMNRKK